MDELVSRVVSEKDGHRTVKPVAGALWTRPERLLLWPAFADCPSYWHYVRTCVFFCKTFKREPAPHAVQTYNQRCCHLIDHEMKSTGLIPDLVDMSHDEDTGEIEPEITRIAGTRFGVAVREVRSGHERFSNPGVDVLRDYERFMGFRVRTPLSGYESFSILPAWCRRHVRRDDRGRPEDRLIGLEHLAVMLGRDRDDVNALGARVFRLERDGIPSTPRVGTARAHFDFSSYSLLRPYLVPSAGNRKCLLNGNPDVRVWIEYFAVCRRLNEDVASFGGNKWDATGS